jgi:hypothetical protein
MTSAFPFPLLWVENNLLPLSQSTLDCCSKHQNGNNNNSNINNITTEDAIRKIVIRIKVKSKSEITQTALSSACHAIAALPAAAAADK